METNLTLQELQLITELLRKRAETEINLRMLDSWVNEIATNVLRSRKLDPSKHRVNLTLGKIEPIAEEELP